MYFAISLAAAHLQRLVPHFVFHPRIKILLISFNIYNPLREQQSQKNLQ